MTTPNYYHNGPPKQLANLNGKTVPVHNITFDLVCDWINIPPTNHIQDKLQYILADIFDAIVINMGIFFKLF